MRFLHRRSTALVPTDRPARYLKQMCSHFAHEAERLGGRVTGTWRVTHDPEHGDVEFGRLGRCTFDAAPAGLRIDLHTPGPVRHAVLRRVIASHVERFGRRDGLTVAWHRAPRAQNSQLS